MVVGGAIGLVIICMFIYSSFEADPDWGRHWRIRPLIVTPFITAFGGLWFHLVALARRKAIWVRVLSYPVSLFFFIISLWLGIVLGLDGTLWD